MRNTVAIERKAIDILKTETEVVGHFERPLSNYS
jgi:hypothetical protein